MFAMMREISSLFLGKLLEEYDILCDMKQIIQFIKFKVYNFQAFAKTNCFHSPVTSQSTVAKFSFCLIFVSVQYVLVVNNIEKVKEQL